MLSQLTVFMQNKEGRLASLCQALADADINMHSLYVADTSDYGVVRIFCDFPQKARKVLNQEGFRASIIPVIGVKVPNVKGGLANLLSFLDKAEVNNEYAIDVLKVDDPDFEVQLVNAGYEIVEKEEIYQRD